MRWTTSYETTGLVLTLYEYPSVLRVSAGVSDLYLVRLEKTKLLSHEHRSWAFCKFDLQFLVRFDMILLYEKRILDCVRYQTHRSTTMIPL